jgi:Zn-dependent peptidase ImmA (M78 family)
MSRITISVSEKVLRWALDRSSRRGKLEKKFPKIPDWLSGEDQPTMRQLEELSKATSTPLGYFFLPNPPEERLSIPYLRTVEGPGPEKPSPDLLETVQTMERRQAWMREYLVELGTEPLSFIRSADISAKPEELACEMRKTLGLSEDWAADQSRWKDALRYLIERMEDAGILVVVNGIVGNNTHRGLDPLEFRGFVLVDEYAPLVFVNGADGKAAQMFTLAHELAHLWFGSSAAFDLRDLQPAGDETEQACNRLAAEFLVPAKKMLEFWPSIKQDSERFQSIARHFKVSELVAARRAIDLDLITKAEFLDFYRRYQDKERSVTKGKDGGDFYATQNLRIGRRFAEAVVRAARESKLLYREAYQLTGLYGDTFEKYAQRIVEGAVGGEP